MHCDVLIVGGGGAALRAAIAAHEAAPDLHVLLITKGKLGQSGVTATACSDRMAFHATLPTTEPGGPDAWRLHADDIYRIGGEVSDADLAEVQARNAAAAFDYLDRLGVPFVRRADGTVDQFVTDGSRYARACYTGPYTANHIHQALLRRFRELGIAAREHTMAVELLRSSVEGRVSGALVVDERTGEPEVIQAGAVVLATGGAGAAFAVHVFSDDCTGDGLAMAYRAGAELVNLEFIQIGLSSLATRLACSGSMLRALPRLVNERGEEFLPDYFAPGTPPSEVYNVLFAKGASWPISLEAPSHRVDIAVERERAAGRRAFLDYSANPRGLDWDALAPEIVEWYRKRKGVDPTAPGMRDSPLRRLQAINPQAVEWLRERGLDLEAGEKVEVAPAVQHFQGGVKIRRRAETSLPGLYAAGEVAGGQHGANRPGGNSLLDCQVFGRIAGESAAADAQSHQERAAPEPALPTLSGDLAAGQMRSRLRALASRAAGVVRTAEGLQEALAELRALRARGLHADAHGLAYALETRNMLDVVELVLTAALRRDESRGPHLRFASPDAFAPLPRDDDRWRRYIVLYRRGSQLHVEVREPVRPGWHSTG